LSLHIRDLAVHGIDLGGHLLYFSPGCGRMFAYGKVYACHKCQHDQSKQEDHDPLELGSPGRLPVCLNETIGQFGLKLRDQDRNNST
jgi:hypothetical protein